MAFKLKDIFSSIGSSANANRAPSGAGDIRRGMDWKYGHGEFADIKKRRKPGESKFDYNVRMKKQGTEVSDRPWLTPDPKTELDLDTQTGDLGIMGTDYTGGFGTDPDDLRVQSTNIEGLLPSEPGDPYSYKKLDEGGFAFKLADGDWQIAEGEGLKAIEKRYKDIDIEGEDIEVDPSIGGPPGTKIIKGKHGSISVPPIR